MIRSLVVAAALATAVGAGAPVTWAEPAPLSAYGQLPKLEDVLLSGSGTLIAMLLNEPDGHTILMLDEQRQPIAKMPLGSSKIRDVEWIGDQALMVTFSQTENLPFGFVEPKFEQFNTLIVPVDQEQEPYLVFEDRPDMLNGVFGQFGMRQIDGRWTGFFGGYPLQNTAMGGYRLRDGRPSLYAVDMATGKYKKVAAPASENMRRDWLIDAGGDVAATMDVDGRTGDWVITDARRKTIASGRQALARVHFVGLGPSGSTAIYSETGEDDIVRWYKVPLDGSASPVEFLPETRVDRLVLDPDSGRIIGYFPQENPLAPTMFDSQDQATVREVIGHFPGRRVLIRTWSGGTDRMILRTDGNWDSGTWHFVDAESDQYDVLAYSRPQIAPESVGPISIFRWKAADNLTIDGILTLPPGRETKNLPLVMLPHGGPTSHDGVGFDWLAQSFAARGYAVLQPNFRGSTNRDEAFVRAGDGEWGLKMQTDISDGLAALVEKGIVDPERACIVGASYGGYAALAGVTLQQGLYKCAVAIAPVTDLPTMFRADLAMGSEMMKKNIMRTLGSRDTFAARSPRRLADKADAPVLLIHGKDDSVVPFEQSAMMLDALKDAHKPVEFVTLENEDHWLSLGTTRMQALKASLDFVEKHNPATKPQG